MKLEFTELAVKNLTSFSKVDQKKIKNKLDYLTQNYDILKNTKNITALVNLSNQYRYKISDSIRAIFMLEDGNITILILKIAHRKDVYK
ncbi:type II toxin-antitoxin system RelE family toxin [Campylobacter geochelonis]|uniref:type II toxin-antitoxin system RelE family toxin n=1 Tax=Campylobacter geochelonis TaxID=1780362 RepID=UPI000770AB6C|nr:type II toxin-antitoxin system RelE/ParE family toxin [Campylobacter geochelonis]CZE50835.1 plasmid addiction system poison protein [Campylobacter geochelonis]